MIIFIWRVVWINGIENDGVLESFQNIFKKFKIKRCRYESITVYVTSHSSRCQIRKERKGLGLGLGLGLGCLFYWFGELFHYFGVNYLIPFCHDFFLLVPISFFGVIYILLVFRKKGANQEMYWEVNGYSLRLYFSSKLASAVFSGIEIKEK